MDQAYEAPWLEDPVIYHSPTAATHGDFGSLELPSLKGGRSTPQPAWTRRGDPPRRPGVLRAEADRVQLPPRRRALIPTT